MTELSQVAVIVRPEADNVAVVLADRLAAGTALRLAGRLVTLPQALANGQSFALREIARGAPVISLGAPFGVARRRIPAGSRVDAANVAAELPRLAPSTRRTRRPAAGTRGPRTRGAQFNGFVRPDGQVGVRNYVGIVTSGMCAASEVREIAQRGQREVYSRAKYPNVDGVVAIVQESGCGMPDGRAVALLNRLLAGCLNHPNLGAALYVDLGCGKTCLECSVPIQRQLLPAYSQRVMNLGIQASGGTRKTIARGLEMLELALGRANRAARQPVSADRLCLGVKCGGSDRWSGISANPALGWAADQIVAGGGGVLIGEIPELQGAAHRQLMSRAIDPQIARKLDRAQRRYQRYVEQFGDDFRENPSPGNIAGGLANVYLKSLGALAKAGESPLSDVLDYGEPRGDRRGLMVVYSPGYDQLSVPALFMAGAQIVAFTTGRGTGIGSALGPVLKIASNSALAAKNEDIDVDAGVILQPAADGAAGDGLHRAAIERVGEEILDRVLAIANGEFVPRAEASGLHQEFKVWESLWPAL